MHDSLELDRQLRQLISAIVALPPRHPDRRRLTQQFVRLVQQSKRLWRAPGTDLETYQNTLSDVWIYVLENFHKYDPARGAVMTWINNRLKWDLKTNQSVAWKEFRQRLWDFGSSEEDVNSWVDRLQANTDGGILLKRIGQRWSEPEILAQTQALHVVHRPDINCHELFQDKLGLSLAADRWLDHRDRDTLQAMSKHYQAPLPTIAGFWTNKCQPLIRVIYRDFDDFAG